MSLDPNTIVLDEAQRADLATVADALGKPWQAVFAEALAAYRAAPDPEESILAAATRLGLVGCVNSGIPDLATNPIHMEGFGLDDA